MAAWMLHGLCFGEEAGARNLVFFRLPPQNISHATFMQPFQCDHAAIARSSIVFCNSVSADRIVVVASRLLGAAAACVILLSFAAEDRKSYWNGCVKAAEVNCQQIFSILALIIFLLKFLLKSASKSSFCRFGVENLVLELQFPTPLHVVLLCLATQSLQIALSWLRQGCLVQRLHA